MLEILADPYLQRVRLNVSFSKNYLKRLIVQRRKKLLCGTQVRELVIDNDRIRIIRITIDALGYEARGFLTERQIVLGS